MAYFNELPNILYPSLLPSSNKIEDRIEVKNIFKRSKLRTDIDQVITTTFQRVIVQILLLKTYTMIQS